MSRHGENIRKRADGRREARFIENYIGGKAKYRYVYAHTYAEAKAKRNQILKESIPKVNGVKSRECLETLPNLWLENIVVLQ